MSRTFAAFRRYQQSLLVIFGILLMIAWTVGGRSGPSGGPNSGTDPVVVSWQDGSLTQSGLQQVRRYHAVAVRFVQQAMGNAITLGAPQQPLPFFVAYNDDRNLVRHWLLSEQAKTMGLEISDETIVDWLNTLTSDSLTAEKFQEILGEGVSQSVLFDALRVELRALQMRGLLGSGIFPSRIAPSPTVAWDLYNRLQRRLVFEFMPVPVSDFMSQVPEPSESELTELYEQFKDRLPDGRPPGPGFRVPLQRAVSYVKFDAQEGLKQEMEKVTEAEVQEYYDSHQEDFRVSADIEELLKSVGPDSPPAESSAPPPTPDGPAAGEAPPAAEPAPPTESGPAPDPSATPSSDSPAADPPAADPPAADPPAADPPAADPPAADPPAADPSCGGGENEGSEPTAESEPTSDGPAPPEPATTEPATAEPATAEPATTEPAAKAAPDDRLDDLLQPPVADPATQETPQYQPMEKVADQIRNAIAAPRLAERVGKSLSEVEEMMNQYYRQHFDWVMNQDTNPEASRPEEPDIAGLAKKLGFKYVVLPLMSAAEFRRNEDIGSAVQIVPVGEQYRREALESRAFGPGIQLFRPVKFGNPGYANEYVFWVTKENKEYTPKLSECRDAVVRAWKLGRAYEPARQKAEELAQQARAAQKTLVDQFVGQNRLVFVPEAEYGISWLTVSSLPLDQGGGVFTSEIPDMPNAGWQTMHDIFRLSPGEYGVTADIPKSVVYVVHVKEEKTTDSDRRSRYLGPSTTGIISYLSIQEQARVINQQLEHLEGEVSLKWHTTPMM